MNKKIMLFARDPGGANVIMALVDPLKRAGYKLELFGKDIALKKYRSEGLKGNNILNFIKNCDMQEIKNFLSQRKPDMVITGTSSEDYVEKFIWKASEELGITAFAILDNWLNYGIRFSRYKASELNQYDSEKKHDYLPSRVLVMDEYAKAEAINQGLPSEKVLVTGQPYFEYVLRKKAIYNKNYVRELRNKYDPDQDRLFITFASEPISNTYQKHDKQASYWGYTEKTIFSKLFLQLDLVAEKIRKKIVLILKLHPKESPDSYVDLKRYQNDNISIFIETDRPPLQLISISDIVCGMSSFFLIEAVLFGKPILSIQIGLNKEDPFVLSRRGITKTVRTDEELTESLNELLTRKNRFKYDFKVKNKPVSEILNLVKASI